MDEILVQEDNTLSSEEDAHENIEQNFDDNNLYQIDNMNIDDKKENI